MGSNLSRALVAFRQTRGLSVTGDPDCDTWRALGGDANGPALVTYRITAEDTGDSFTKIPSDLVEQAALSELGYRSLVEKLAERFHVAPAFLQALNRGSRLAGGEEIKVPAASPFDPNVKPSVDPAATDVVVQVMRDESTVRVTRPDGTLVFFAPVSSGSSRDPLPVGDWKVTSTNWHPIFRYDPSLFWDAKGTHTKATIKPGPNNPVGVVWIGLSLEHYGLHGTPEPGRVGYTQSHGCVRLTNWDAARLSSLVKTGTPVLFR